MTRKFYHFLFTHYLFISDDFCMPKAAADIAAPGALSFAYFMAPSNPYSTFSTCLSISP